MLEGPRVWEAGSTQDGRLLEDWVWPQGALPEDALSITLAVSGVGQSPLSIGVRDAEDRVLVDPRSPEFSPNRLLRGREMVVGMIPSASTSLPLAGNFRISAQRLGGARDEGSLTIRAWVKRSGRDRAVPAVQQLAVSIVTVGRGPDEGRLGQALAEVARIWTRAGIELGADRPRLRLPGAEAAAFERLAIDRTLGSDSPPLRALLSLSERAAAGTLALFLVDEISAGPGFPIWALAGAIPVPPAQGTPRSGIVVSSALLDGEPLRAGQAVAHEIGHALGLYHTTERELQAAVGALGPRPIHDQIDDTPACPSEADVRPADGVLSSEECAAFDATNLMFWSGAREAVRITPAQADIARRSALVR